MSDKEESSEMNDDELVLHELGEILHNEDNPYDDGICPDCKMRIENCICGDDEEEDWEENWDDEEEWEDDDDWDEDACEEGDACPKCRLGNFARAREVDRPYGDTCQCCGNLLKNCTCLMCDCCGHIIEGDLVDEDENDDEKYDDSEYDDSEYIEDEEDEFDELEEPSLPKETIDEIKREVRRIIDLLAQAGIGNSETVLDCVNFLINWRRVGKDTNDPADAYFAQYKGCDYWSQNVADVGNFLGSDLIIPHDERDRWSKRIGNLIFGNPRFESVHKYRQYRCQC